MSWVDTVNPDYRIASTHFGMECLTARISNQSTLLESEDVNKKSLRSLNVLVNSQRNNSVLSPWRSFLPNFGRAQLRRRRYFQLTNLRIPRNLSQLSFIVLTGAMVDGIRK